MPRIRPNLRFEAKDNGYCAAIGHESITALVASGEVSAMRTTCLNFNLGVLPWYPMERHQISDRLELLVNLDTRNVVLSYRELTVKGTGLNMSADRFYNAQSSSGWIHSGTEIGLENPGFTSGNMRILHGPNEYCVKFPENADGTFAPAEHFRASLTKTPESGYVVTFNDSGEPWLFTGQGWFVSQTDRNGNANTNRYRPDGSLASITDSQGRVTTFNRDTQGRDSSLTDPTGQTFGNYVYTAGRLSELSDRAGQKVKFGYDTARDLLTSVTDGRGNTWKLEYDPDSTRITKLTEPTRDGTGAAVQGHRRPRSRPVAHLDGQQRRQRHDQRDAALHDLRLRPAAEPDRDEAGDRSQERRRLHRLGTSSPADADHRRVGQPGDPRLRRQRQRDPHPLDGAERGHRSAALHRTHGPGRVQKGR
ncbi:hypothetical protein [Lentzea sp.]|uniref:hypothetical protein n=1 Tax=Lentzea sp. TaxID=56099 RepID=UPI002ED23F58